jgi:hypothetical protein
MLQAPCSTPRRTRGDLQDARGLRAHFQDPRRPADHPLRTGSNFVTTTFNHGFVLGNAAGRGAGVFVSNGELRLNNSVVNANAVSSQGGGGGAGATGVGGGLFLSFCTVTKNAAGSGGAGGAFHLTVGHPGSKPESILEVRNSIVWNNTSGDRRWVAIAPQGIVAVRTSFSDIGSDNESVSIPGLGVGDIRATPGFAPEEEQPDGVEYRLVDGSICRNGAQRHRVFRGSYSEDPEEPFLPWCTDVDGRCRMVGERPDMGAFEVQDPTSSDCGDCNYG